MSEEQLKQLGELCADFGESSAALQAKSDRRQATQDDCDKHNAIETKIIRLQNQMRARGALRSRMARAEQAGFRQGRERFSQG